MLLHVLNDGPSGVSPGQHWSPQEALWWEQGRNGAARRHWQVGGSEDSIETRFQVLPPPGASFEGPLAVSPDGHWLAFVALSGGETRLWVRPRNSVIAQSLEGTTGARSPFWSPDSRSIAFFAAGRLKRIVLSGGLPQSIADAANPTGGTWSRDDVILFVPYNEVALCRIAAGGGELIRVPSVDPSGQVLVPVDGISASSNPSIAF